MSLSFDRQTGLRQETAEVQSKWLKTPSFVCTLWHHFTLNERIRSRPTNITRVVIVFLPATRQKHHSVLSLFYQTRFLAGMKSTHETYSDSLMGSSLTDVTSLAPANPVPRDKSWRSPGVRKDPTCSCSTCTCSLAHRTFSSAKNSRRFDGRLDKQNDCLTHAFVVLYDSSLWCLLLIYELLFKSFWQLFLYVREEIRCYRYDNPASMHGQLSEYRLPTSPRKQRLPSRRYKSNQNSNRARSPPRRKESSKTLQSIDTRLVVVSLRSSYCQTVPSKQDVRTVQIDINRLDGVQRRETPVDELLSRRLLHEPLRFITRDTHRAYLRAPSYSLPQYPNRDVISVPLSGTPRQLLVS